MIHFRSEPLRKISKRQTYTHYYSICLLDDRSSGAILLQHITPGEQLINLADNSVYH